jgi:hypothetical protein
MPEITASRGDDGRTYRTFRSKSGAKSVERSRLNTGAFVTTDIPELRGHVLRVEGDPGGDDGSRLVCCKRLERERERDRYWVQRNLLRDA